MKRFFPILLTLSLLILPLLLASCTPSVPPDTTDPTLTTPPPETDPVTEPVTEPPKESEAVFLNGRDGNDTNDGLTPETAVLSIHRAFALLSPERNCIVVMNTPKTDVSQVLPDYGGTVIFTSLYNGIDYAVQNNAGFQIFKTLTLSCDTVFQNITILQNCSIDSQIFCRFHNLTIAESARTSGSESHPATIYAGYDIPDTKLDDPNPIYARDLGFNGDCEINLFGGHWKMFCGGNYRRGVYSPVATFQGNLTVNIGGTAEFCSGDPADDLCAEHFTATGMNFQRGSVTLNISGGTFHSPLYAFGRRGLVFGPTYSNGKVGTDGIKQGSNVTYTANVTVNFTGGTFTEGVTEICALRNPGETPLTGSYTLNITGGSFPAGIRFSARGVLGKSEISGAPENAAFLDFDTVNGKAQSAPKSLRIACVGDSLTWGYLTTDVKNAAGYLYESDNFSYPSVLQTLCGESVIIGNFGYPGATVYNGGSCNYYTSHAYNLLEEFQPDVIVIMLGTNNISLLPDKVAGVEVAYKLLLRQLHTKSPNAPIFLMTCLRRLGDTEKDQLLEQYIRPLQKKLAESYDYLTLIDAHTEFLPYASRTYYNADKLHLTNRGYEKLAEIVHKGIAGVLPDSAK